MRLGSKGHKSRGQGAFSLLELSVVLTVIALIAGVGMTIASNALKAADRISTQEKLNMIKLALDSHAKTYGYLPCPADRTLTPSSANFGVEDRNAYAAGTATNCSTIVGSIVPDGGNTILTGGVPVRSLGLPDSYAGDAWGNKFAYTMTYSVTYVSNPTHWSTSVPKIAINYGVPSGTFYSVSTKRLSLTSGTASNAGGLTITYGSTTPSGGSAPTTSTLLNISSTSYKGSYTPTSVTGATVVFAANPAYVAADTGVKLEWQDTSAGALAASYAVVSHGPNGLGAYPMNGTAVAVACAGTTIDAQNCDNDATFYETDYNDDTTTATSYFDDYIVWGSNESARPPVSNTLYTSSSNACPSNICEPWCAACERNYPAQSLTLPANIPPTGAGETFSSAAGTPGVVFGLCKKVVTSNSTNCKAACFWGGVSASGTTPATSLYRCP